MKNGRLKGTIDVSVSIEEYEKTIGILIGISLVILFSIYLSIWGISVFLELLSVRSIVVFIGMSIGGLILHELIHALFILLFGEWKLSAIKFGYNLKQGMVICNIFRTTKNKLLSP